MGYIYWCNFCNKEYHLTGKTKEKPIICKKCHNENIEVIGVPIYDLKGIGEEITKKLSAHEVRLVSDLCSFNVVDIQKIPGVGKKTAKKIFEQVKKWYPDYQGKNIKLTIKDGKIKKQ
jgi:NAD-dependent DNA ligase